MLNNKVFVRFLITDFNVKPSEITDLVGIAPTKTWEEGDLKFSKGTIKYKSNGWELYISDSDVLHVEILLKRLIFLLLPYQKQIALLENVTKVISIIVYSNNQMPSLSYDRECLEFIVAIKATLDQDIYC
jgi:hypothetical protein